MNPRRFPSRPLRAVALAATAAFAPGTAAAQETVELPARDRMLNASFQEVFTVGTFDGADWETFGEVAQVGFDAQGNLHILDAQVSRFVVVDREGRFVRQWGQAGEGPGEWRNVVGAAVFRDGATAVADMGHGVLQLFSPEGEFLGTGPLRDGAVTRVGTIQPDPRGGAVFNGGGPTRMAVESDGSGPPSLPTNRPVERITLGEDGAKRVFYEAWQPPLGEDDEQEMRGVQIRIRGQPPIFSPGLHAAALPDGGLAVADSASWLVKILGPDGRVVRRLVRDIEPVEVTSRVEDAYLERRIAEIEAGEGPRMRIVTDDGSGPREMPADQINRMMIERLRAQGFYPVIPVIQELAAGWDGTLWLERDDGPGDEPGVVDLFTADGTYRGSLASDGPGVPDAFGPDGLVAYIERDEMEVPVVRVMRLPAGLRPGR